MKLVFLFLVTTTTAMAVDSALAQAENEAKRWVERMKAEHDLRLREWRPETNAVVPVTPITGARYPIIDVHQHVSWPTLPTDEAELKHSVEVMDRMNVQTAVNLTGGWGEPLRRSIEAVDRYPGRFVTCALPDWSKIDEPDFADQAVRNLEQAHRMGARCLKILKILGLYLKDGSGRFVPVDDRRLDPIWAKCGELNIPVLIHTADPISFFKPWDERNENYVILWNRPEWYFGGPDYSGTPRNTHQELMRQRDAIVERHPGTQFVGLHYASLSHDLAALGGLLDRYPNLMVEMGARNWALGSVPNSGRKFAIQYQDRILFGTDAKIEERLYAEYIRTLETDDDMIKFGIPRRWGVVHGVHLPDPVLRKIYRDNALKLFPFLE